MSVSTELRVKELLREKGWTTKELAEKTGMSESYLTHIKNGTRRWNEDSLKKLSSAFGLQPTEMFLQKRKRTDKIEQKVELPQGLLKEVKIRVVPVLGDVPANPSPYNNQLVQEATGFAEKFVAVEDTGDAAMFALAVSDNLMSPTFVKGDLLVISPGIWTRSGNISAIEYGNENPVKAIVQVTFTEDFIVCESVNHKHPPVALVKGKDNFRIIGKVVRRIQEMP